jgi:hypothetical protein
MAQQTSCANTQLLATSGAPNSPSVQPVILTHASQGHTCHTRGVRESWIDPMALVHGSARCPHPCHASFVLADKHMHFTCRRQTLV